MKRRNTYLQTGAQRDHSMILSIDRQPVSPLCLDVKYRLGPDVPCNKTTRLIFKSENMTCQRTRGDNISRSSIF